MDIDWLSAGVGFVASLIASYVFPIFRRFVDTVISLVTTLLSPDSFNLSGTWEYSYSEPDPADPKRKREDVEKVRLRQIGNILWGKGETKLYKREFKYRLQLRHNIVSGTYKKVAKKGVAAGGGVVQLVVSADRSKMKGSTAWMDADTNETETDQVTWTLIS